MTVEPPHAFLMKRGLSRDRANLVTLLIRQRQELAEMRKNVRDPDVVQEITDLFGFLGEEIEMMYHLQAEEERTRR